MIYFLKNVLFLKLFANFFFVALCTTLCTTLYHWSFIICLLHEFQHPCCPRNEEKFSSTSKYYLTPERMSRRRSQSHHSGKSRDYGHVLKQEIVKWDVRKSFFTTRTVEQRKRLPSEDVSFPSLKVFQKPSGL